MKIKYLLICLLLVGCTISKIPTKEYYVKLIKPDGKLYESYIIQSEELPILNTTMGGQIECYFKKHNYVYSTNIIAPVGWALTVEEKYEDISR